jgi:hypothetical protein
MSLDDMIQKSTAIVRGRVTSSSAAFRGSIIYTHYQIQVLERWKGPSQASQEVLVPGGTVRGLRQTFSGSPQLVEGNEYLLFLWTSKSGLTQIIGFTQGMFELPKGSATPMAIHSATSETMLDPNTGQAVQDQRIEMRLSDLTTHITTSLRKGVQ